jgi:hypothetical protein
VKHGLQRRKHVDRTEDGFGEGPCNDVFRMKAFHLFERCANGPEFIVNHFPLVVGESRDQVSLSAQNALWHWVGVPEQHRSDSLSAAFCNLDRDAQEDLTRRYEDPCAHYP